MARRPGRKKSRPVEVHVRGDGFRVDASFTVPGLRLFAQARDVLAPPQIVEDNYIAAPEATPSSASASDGDHQHFTPESARMAAEGMCDVCLAAFSAAATAELSRRRGHDARAS